MKIAVYAITKNEAGFVDRCLESVLPDADYVVIADSGSTDRTNAKLMKWQQAFPGVVRTHAITVAPWRFDLARNASLALIPADADVCVCLDLDEVMQPGWRDGIEAAWTPQTTRLRYPYVWSWEKPGVPGVSYYADKIHARGGYRWTHPCHEVLRPYLVEELQTWTSGVEIHHHPDETKGRGSYLTLLALAAEEDPLCDRTAFYFGRELFFRGLDIPALDELARHRSLPTAQWDLERCASWRFSAKALTRLDRHDEARAAIDAAISEAPHIREPYFDGAILAHARGDLDRARDLLVRAKPLERPDMAYIAEAAAYGPAFEKLLRSSVRD